MQEGVWRADHNTQYLVTFFNAKTHVLLRSSCVVQLARTQLNTSSHTESAHTPQRMHTRDLTQPYARDNTLSPHTGGTRAREGIYSVSERERDFDCSQIDFLSFLVAFSSLESSTYQLHFDTTSSWQQLHLISFAGFCLTLISYTTDRQWPFMWGFSFSLEYWLNF